MRIGLLGCGNVGAALVQLIAENGDAVAARTGLRLEVTRVAVHDPAKPRSVDLPAGVFTGDAAAVVADPDVDLVVEVIGGVEPAKTLVLAALESGKPVVTANKELLADCGAELFDAAAKAGVDLLFEAAVAGAIPIMRPLRESLAGDRIQRVLGIVNGTTNFILTRMSEKRAVLRRGVGGGPVSSGTPSAIPPPTSRASTPRPRRPSSPASPSASTSGPPTCTARGSPGSPPTTSPWPPAWATW